MRTRPSTETTPPPLQQQTTNAQQTNQQQTQGSGTINFNMGNDITMVQTIKNFDEVSFVEKSHKHKILKTRYSSKDN
jgi:hypothetical protein